MDKFDRFQHLHRLFSTRKRPVPIKQIAERLECTEHNAKRLIHQLRDYWAAPLIYDDRVKGWFYDLKQGEKFELPGLWLTADELQSLTALLHLIHNMNQGVVSDELKTVEKSIEKLLHARGIAAADFTQHIKYLPIAKRDINHHNFTTVADALIQRKQLQMVYRDYRNKKTTRTISPQTLVYYRENWQLDAWCHLRKQLRTFSISRIDRLEKQTQKAETIPPETLAQHFSSSYGIFAGQAKYTAKLRFHPEVAREIASQQWHPEQKGQWQGKDYLLHIPYNHDAELIMDILKYGHNVEVLEPTVLRKRVKGKLCRALALYE